MQLTFSVVYRGKMLRHLLVTSNDVLQIKYTGLKCSLVLSV